MKTKPQDFQHFIDSLRKMDKDKLRAEQEKQHQQDELEYKSFKDNFSRGLCYLCGQKLNRCDYDKPCIHWLLRKHKRIKKKHVEQALKSKDLFQIIAFLRWIANTNPSFDNVNDFEAYESNNNLLYHETISYDGLSWTFWIKKSDLEGHKGRNTDFPHYHFHMEINKQIFIRFGEFHIPLREWDILTIYMRKDQYDGVGFRIRHGETYSDLFKTLPTSEIIGKMRRSEDESKAQFNIQTVVEAKPGKFIKGEDIARMAKESKEKGIPMAALLQNLDANVKSMVTPLKLIEPVLRKGSKKGR